MSDRGKQIRLRYELSMERDVIVGVDEFETADTIAEVVAVEEENWSDVPESYLAEDDYEFSVTVVSIEEEP